MALGKLVFVLILVGFASLAPTTRWIYAQEQPRIVRSIKCVGTGQVSIDEILGRFKARNVQIGVERPYDADQAKRAAFVLEELLAEHGRKAVRVEAATTPLPPRSVEIRFRVRTE